MEKKKVLKARVAVIEKKELFIHTEFIKLDSALKLADIASTGGMAKNIVEEGLVKVNGEICAARGKKLRDGDSFEYGREIFTVKAEK